MAAVTFFSRSRACPFFLLRSLIFLSPTKKTNKQVTASSATLLDPSPSLLDPDSFAFSRAFDFERVIGRSELSEVWLARHRSSGRRFAVKRSAPPPGFVGGAAAAAAAGGGPSSSNSRKTAREVSVVARVPPHPNLVGVQRSWREAGSGSFIQMDYCRGGSLAEAVRRAVRRSKRAAARRRRSSGSGGGDGGEGDRREQPATTTTTAAVTDASDAAANAAVPAALPEAAVWRVAAHAAAALEALHASRVIHMDVKPENIYLDWKEEEGEEEEEGEGGKGGRQVVTLRLGDFGISIPAEDGRYCAPELLSSSSSSSGSSSSSSSPRPTPAADVFSLGATLFECATGNPPPRGAEALPAAEAAAAVVAALGGGGSGPFSSSSSSSSSSPSSSAALLAGLVASAMLPDPRARPSAAQLARAAAEGDAGFRRREGGSGHRLC